MWKKPQKGFITKQQKSMAMTGNLYVMELKIDKTAREALEQIDSKDYLLPFAQSGLRLHKVGISFSTKERTLSEWKIVNV